MVLTNLDDIDPDTEVVRQYEAQKILDSSKNYDILSSFMAVKVPEGKSHLVENLSPLHFEF